jgi:hypothetical protein
MKDPELRFVYGLFALSNDPTASPHPTCSTHGCKADAVGWTRDTREVTTYACYEHLRLPIEGD